MIEFEINYALYSMQLFNTSYGGSYAFPRDSSVGHGCMAFPNFPWAHVTLGHHARIPASSLAVDKGGESALLSPRRTEQAPRPMALYPKRGGALLLLHLLRRDCAYCRHQWGW